MKFTYTHITKDYTEITKYTVNKSNKIMIKENNWIGKTDKGGYTTTSI